LDAKQEIDMANLFELKKQHGALLTQAETLLASTEREKRSMTTEEKTLFDGLMAAQQRAKRDIETIEAKYSLLTTMRAGNGMLLPGNPNAARPNSSLPLGNNPAEHPIRVLSADYQTAFNDWVSSVV
jgi:hypothetical protein